MFSPFQDLFQKAVARHGMTEMVTAASVCAKFTELKPKIFPEDTAKNLEVKHFKNATLTIMVPDTVWANEVLNRQISLIQDINATFGKTVIEKIKTELKQMKSEESSL